MELIEQQVEIHDSYLQAEGGMYDIFYGNGFFVAVHCITHTPILFRLTKKISELNEAEIQYILTYTLGVGYDPNEEVSLRDMFLYGEYIETVSMGISVAKIKKSNFIDWVFNSGSDQEREQDTRILGERVLEQLKEGYDAKVFIDTLWEEAMVDQIPCHYFEGYSKSNTDEIGLYENIKEYELIEG